MKNKNIKYLAILLCFFSIIFFNFFKNGLFSFHDYTPTFLSKSLDANRFVWIKNANLGEFNPLAVASIPISLFIKLSLIFNNVFIGEIITIIGIVLFGFVSSYLYFHYLYKNIPISVTLSLFYIFNLFVVCRVYDGHIYLVSIYYSLPIFIYTISKYFSQKEYFSLYLVQFFLLSLIFGGGHGNTPMSIGTLFVPVFIFLVIEYVFSKNRLVIIKKIGILVLITVLSNLYWLLPTGYYYLHGFNQSLISEGKTFGFNWPDVENQQGGILSIIYGNSHWLWNAKWAGDWWYYFSPIYNNSSIIKISLLVFPVLAISSFLIKQSFSKKYLYIFSGVLIVIHTLLANGIQEPTGEIWKFLYSNIPLFNIFRAPPTKFGGPIYFAICILAGLTMQKIINRKRINFLVISLSILSILVLSYPLISGGVFFREKKGYWDNRNVPTIPDEYINISKILNDDIYDSNVYEYPFGHFGFFDLGYKKYEGIDILNGLTDRNLISICSGFSIDCTLLNNFQTEINSKLNEFGVTNSRYILKRNDLFSYDDPLGTWKNDFVINNKNLEIVYESKLLTLYKVPDKYFLPHIYLDKIDEKSKDDPSIEYKKISNVTYKVIIKNVTSPIKITFNESNNKDWKIYPIKFDDKYNRSFEYSKFDNNLDQASIEEITKYVKQNKITAINNKEKYIEYKRWNKYQYVNEKIQKYTTDFISKEIHGTIQNENINGVNLWATWLKKPIRSFSSENINTSLANDWNIDPQKICVENKKSCHLNNDGSFDISIVIEFWPQRLFYIGIGMSIIALLCTIVIVGIKRINPKA